MRKSRNGASKTTKRRKEREIIRIDLELSGEVVAAIDRVSRQPRATWIKGLIGAAVGMPEAVADRRRTRAVGP